MPAQPVTLKTALWLRLVSLMAFPAGAVLMAVYQRSPLTLAVLTAAMLLVSLIERRRMGVAGTINTGGLVAGFAVRLGLLIGLFVLVNGVLTLFRDTVLARALGTADAVIIALAAGAALAANEISARIAKREIGALRSAFDENVQRSRGGPGRPGVGGDIIEGEIIPDDEPTPR